MRTFCRSGVVLKYSGHASIIFGGTDCFMFNFEGWSEKIKNIKESEMFSYGFKFQTSFYLGEISDFSWL